MVMKTALGTRHPTGINGGIKVAKVELGARSPLKFGLEGWFIGRM